MAWHGRYNIQPLLSSQLIKVSLTLIKISYMKKSGLLLLLLLVMLFSCRTASDSNAVLEDIQENLEFGNLSAVNQIVDSLRKTKDVSNDILHVADSLDQIADRIRVDFSVSAAKFKSQVGDSVTPEKISECDKKGWIEYRTIDGEKKYFNRAASNMFLLRNFYGHKSLPQDNYETNPEKIFRLQHTTLAVKEADHPGNPLRMTVTYTLTVQADAVPDGEKIRCWLPWPKSGSQRQTNINLISTSEKKYEIAPDTAIHSSIYMEGVSKKGIPSVFQISFSYSSSSEYFDLQTRKILPYDRSSSLYKKYTSEQLPHICFNDNVKHLADSLTAGEIDPKIIVREIYTWFKENIPWSGALEYSIMPNIPDYVLKNKRGDCGMQTFLLMSMLRYKGVPVRWQSGWMMSPADQNLHDWSEVYYEGIGWVPVDVTFDLQKSDNDKIKYFFYSGIDAYRLIVNEGIAGPLHPEKQFLRSEPYDFQRGEVEWKGGNLYFDKWDYEMKITYDE
jgi:transglutaminase-like putative cysteine protease